MQPMQPMQPMQTFLSWNNWKAACPQCSRQYTRSEEGIICKHCKILFNVCDFPGCCDPDSQTGYVKQICKWILMPRSYDLSKFAGILHYMVALLENKNLTPDMTMDDIITLGFKVASGETLWLTEKDNAMIYSPTGVLELRGVYSWKCPHCHNTSFTNTD